MCGLVGVAGNTGLKEARVFRDMLIFDTIRGIDSTGFIGVPKNYKNGESSYLNILKEVGLPYELFKGNQGVFSKNGVLHVPKRIMMGHNRAATIGNITKENAHPFEFDNVVGMHNGSLTDYYDLDGYKNFDVDSQVLFNHINNHGVVDAWANMIGPAAITAYDKKNDKLLFARNDERPLYLAWNEKKDVLLWASELWMIQYACERNDLELAIFKDKNKQGKDTIYLDIRPLKKNELHVFEVNNDSVKLVDTQPLKHKEKVTQVGFYNYADYTDWWDREWKKREEEWERQDHGKRHKEPNVTTPHLKADKQWTKGTKRCSKNTRDLSFIVEGAGYRTIIDNNSPSKTSKQHYIFAKFINGMHQHQLPRFRIIFDGNLKMWDELLNGIRTQRVFNTSARLRFYEENGYRIYVTSSSNVTLTNLLKVRIKLSSAKHPVFVEEENDPDTQDQQEENTKNFGKFHPLNGQALSNEEFWELVKNLGDRCSICGHDFEHDKADDIHLHTEDIVLCKGCKDSPLTQQYLNGEYH